MAEFREFIWTETKDVTGLPSESIWNHIAPQDINPPYVVFQISDYEPCRHLAAVNNFRRYEVTFNVVSSDNVTAWTIADAIRSKWDHVRLTNVPLLQTTRSFVQLFLDGYEPPESGAEQGHHLMIVVVDFWHNDD